MNSKENNFEKPTVREIKGKQKEKYNGLVEKIT